MKKILSVIFSAAIFALCAADAKNFDLSKYIRSRYKAGERDIVLPDGKLKCRVMTL